MLWVEWIWNEGGVLFLLKVSVFGEIVMPPLLCILLELYQNALVVFNCLSVKLLLYVALDALPLLSELEKLLLAVDGWLESAKLSTGIGLRFVI